MSQSLICTFYGTVIILKDINERNSEIGKPNCSEDFESDCRSERWTTWYRYSPWWWNLLFRSRGQKFDKIISCSLFWLLTWSPACRALRKPSEADVQLAPRPRIAPPAWQPNPATVECIRDLIPPRMVSTIHDVPRATHGCDALAVMLLMNYLES